MQSPLMPAPTTTVSAASATERPCIERLEVASVMEQRSFGKRKRRAGRVGTRALVGVRVKKRGTEPRRKTEEAGRSVAVVLIMAIGDWPGTLIPPPNQGTYNK